MEIGSLGQSQAALLDKTNLFENKTAIDQKPETENRSGEDFSADDKATLSGEEELTTEEKREVERLNRTDREVRAHETAHRSAAGQYARGGATYVYERGPDGKLYATGGEVSLDVSEVPNDPEATARKMQQVRRAAQAPADPSPQDRRVAVEATVREAAAHREMMEKRTEDLSDNENNPLDKSPRQIMKYGYSDMFPIQQLLDVMV